MIKYNAVRVRVAMVDLKYRLLFFCFLEHGKAKKQSSSESIKGTIHTKRKISLMLGF